MRGVFAGLNCQQARNFKESGQEKTKRESRSDACPHQHQTLGRHWTSRQVSGVNHLNAFALLLTGGISGDANLLRLHQQRIVLRLLRLIVAIQRAQGDLGSRNIIDARHHRADLSIDVAKHGLLAFRLTIDQL